jgi:L-alanine-DL-glutamate epimerase-like enolase superfamily enzyme
VVDGNQQTAHMMTDDIVTETIPITFGPDWGVPQGHGIGVEIDQQKLAKYHELYQKHGQLQPYDPLLIGTELYR